MGYLCSDFLKSTVMCFLRPIVQFELTFVGDCTCPASSVASLAALERARWQLQRRCSCLILGDERSQHCLLLHMGERERDQPAFLGSLVCRAMELHLLLSILFFCSLWFFFFLSSESFWLWIYFRMSDKLSILSAYITHENKWWLCIYIVQNIFIHFNIAQILNYLKVCFPFFQELYLSLKQGYHLNYCSFIKSHSFECFMYFVAIFLNIYCKCTLQF